MTIYPLPRHAVYRITHKVTGHYYIGSTNNFYSRISLHRTSLALGKHSNHNLQSSYTTWEDYDIWFSYCTDRKEAIREEQKLLNKHHGLPLCCNIFPMADSAKGSKRSLEDRLYLSKAHKGKSHSTETKRKMAVSQSKRTHSEEVRLKISMLRKGNPRPSKPVKVSLDGVIFNSLSEASRKLNVAPTTIRKRITGKLKGYPNWVYLEK